jgi:hypothetical protein
MFENRERMEILGPKREQVIRHWRKFHSEAFPGYVFQIKHNRGDEIREDETGMARGTYETRQN